jgi:allantoinase
VGEADLLRALAVLASAGVPLLAHAELPGPIEAAARTLSGDPRSYSTYLASRPAAAEVLAAELLVGLCRDTAAHVHLVHVSAAEVLPVLREAHSAGLPMSAETCPHYLHLAADDVLDGATEYKCAPPIRGRENRDALWAALAAGELDMIASDHSPCPPQLKLCDTGDFLHAWGGIASLQLGLSVVWAGARARGHGPVDLARWMAEAPARLAGLAGRKGAIAPGRDADIAVWRPEDEWTVGTVPLFHRHSLTPYAGMTLPGRVVMTLLRGETIYASGQPIGPCRGRLIGRGVA